MFRHQDTVRVAALNAVINLLLAEQLCNKDGLYSLQDSSSQASCSQQGEMACSMGSGSLFQELSGLMQRCLYQQVLICSLKQCFCLCVLVFHCWSYVSGKSKRGHV